MTTADTDKLDPKKPITAETLVESLSKFTAVKKGSPATLAQMVVVAILTLGGSGIGQQIFGVSREALEKETSAIKAQNTELLKRVDTQTTTINMLEQRIVRLETKIELGAK